MMLSQESKPHECGGLTIQFMLFCFYFRDWEEILRNSRRNKMYELYCGS